MLNFQVQDLGPICKVDGCTREGLHQKHRIRGWCSDPGCKHSEEPILRWPRINGDVACACGQLLITEQPTKNPWRDLAGRAAFKIFELKKLALDTILPCPWREAFGSCSSCRCQAGQISAVSLIAHYAAMFELYDTKGLSALDDAIVSSVTRYEPKRFADVLDDVENNYGKISPKRETSKRMLHRHLRSLAERGHVLCVDVGESLRAYLKPGSPIAGDVRSIRDYFRSTMVIG